MNALNEVSQPHAENMPSESQQSEGGVKPYPDDYLAAYRYALANGWAGEGAELYATTPDEDPPEGYTREGWRGARAAIRCLEGDTKPAESPWPKGSVVYFMQCAKTGAVKIGTTIDLQSRYHALRTNLPYGINRIWFCEGAGREMEQGLHKLLANHRLSGEWFEPAEPVMASLKGETIKEVTRVNGQIVGRVNSWDEALVSPLVKNAGA